MAIVIKPFVFVTTRDSSVDHKQRAYIIRDAGRSVSVCFFNPQTLQLNKYARICNIQLRNALLHRARSRKLCVNYTETTLVRYGVGAEGSRSIYISRNIVLRVAENLG